MTNELPPMPEEEAWPILMLARKAGFDELAIFYETDKLLDFAAAVTTEDRAQCDATHLAELRAYELTVANLREQLQAVNSANEVLSRNQRMLDDGTFNQRLYSAGIEQEKEITALREQLAQRGEPIARLSVDPYAGVFFHLLVDAPEGTHDLFTHPQAPQVPMTDAEINSMWSAPPGTNSIEFARAVEAHHGIKETP